MKNFTLFIIGFLAVAFVLMAGEVSKTINDQPDYQAYTPRPRFNMEDYK